MLRFQKTANVNNAGVSHANVRFSPTYTYDVDPILGSTAVPGFSELTAIYRWYRVRRVRYKVSIVNTETFPIVACTCPVNFDPAANTPNFQNYNSSRRAKTKVLSIAGGMDRAVLSGQFSIADFGGAAEILLPDVYGGTGSASPANLIWLFVGINTVAGGALVGGATFDIDLDIELDFFELSNPST